MRVGGPDSDELRKPSRIRPTSASLSSDLPVQKYGTDKTLIRQARYRLSAAHKWVRGPDLTTDRSGERRVLSVCDLRGWRIGEELMLHPTHGVAPIARRSEPAAARDHHPISTRSPGSKPLERAPKIGSTDKIQKPPESFADERESFGFRALTAGPRNHQRFGGVRKFGE